jgi:hypothetical protein
MKMKYALLTAALLAGMNFATAGPITIVSDSGTGNGQDILSVVAGEEWTQTGSYSGVTISATLAGGVVFPGTGIAYLMNQIGPGTTAANQLASPFAVTAPTASNSSITLFSGLTLGPGTYYLLITGSSSTPVGWPGTSNPTYTEDAGVSGVAELLTSTQATYAPASTFTPSSSGAFFFGVTGTPVVGTTTPEPGTLGTLGAGLAGLIVVIRRRARA